MLKVKKFFTNRGPISVVVSVVLSVLLVVGIVEAATTISSNISTGGTLTVTGTSALTGAVTATAGIISGANIVSDTDSEDSLGLTGTRWASIFSDNFTGNTITLDGATGVNILTITDSVADALSIVRGSTDFMVFDTSTPAFTITPNTSIGGTLSVTGASTLTGDVSASGTLEATGVLTATAGIVSGSNITVPPTYGLDTATGGVLNIGPSTATSIIIGDAGVLTTIQGTLNVDDAATFDTTLGVTGATTLSGTLGVTGDAIFDTNTLFVDVSANSVGIGTSTPANQLEVHGTATTTISVISETASTGGRIILEDSDGLGCTEIYVLDGVITSTIVDCPAN